MKNLYIESVKFSLTKENDKISFNSLKEYLKLNNFEGFENEYFRIWFYDNFYINHNIYFATRNGPLGIAKNAYGSNNEEEQNLDKEKGSVMEGAYKMYQNDTTIQEASKLSQEASKLSKIALGISIIFPIITIGLTLLLYFLQNN